VCDLKAMVYRYTINIQIDAQCRSLGENVADLGFEWESRLCGTGVSEWLPSTNPVATSADRTDRRAGFVKEGSDQDAQLCVVLRLRRGKEGFMNILNRSFARLLMIRGSSPVREDVLDGVLQCRVLVGDCGSFLGGVVSGMGREGTVDHGARVMFPSCHAFKQTKIYVFMYCVICCRG